MNAIEPVILRSVSEQSSDIVPATYVATVQALGYDPLGLIEVKKMNWLQRLLTWVR